MYKIKNARCVFAVLLLSAPVIADTIRVTSVRDMYPSPSPDGATIVFQSNRTGVNQIYSMDAEGNHIRQLTDFSGGAETPGYSPDGKWLVFAAFVDGEGRGNDVFVMRPDGSDSRRLTNSPGFDDHPHWTADGKRIVFNSERTTPDPTAAWHLRWHEIFSMNADGSDIVQHTRCRSVCTYGSMSPDGNTLLYRKVVDAPGFNWYLELGARNSQIYIADADGRNERNISNSAAFDGWPVWSADGTQIAFSSNRAGPALVGQVYLMHADGSNIRQVSSGPWSHVQPAWSADGKRLYVYQVQESEDFEVGGVAIIELSASNDDATDR